MFIILKNFYRNVLKSLKISTSRINVFQKHDLLKIIFCKVLGFENCQSRYVLH